MIRPRDTRPAHTDVSMKLLLLLTHIQLEEGEGGSGDYRTFAFRNLFSGFVSANSGNIWLVKIFAKFFRALRIVTGAK